MPTLSAVVITRNEAARIAACLRSLAFADEIVVVDDESTDETARIAAEYGARVIVHRHAGENWDLNKNVGMEAATGDWVLLIDADEQVPEACARALRALIASEPAEAGFWLPRREHYFGYHPRHATSSARVLRLFRRGKARFVGEHLHEQPTVDGALGHFDQAIDHFAYATIADYLEKTNRYTDHEARHLYAAGRRAGWRELVIEPLRLFRYRFIKLKGYKDGMPGLVYCLLTSLYPLLQYAKLWELGRSDARPRPETAR